MPENKKRIAFLINTLSVGGAERVVSNLSLCLADKYEVDILVNNDKQVAFPYGGRIISLGLPVCRDRMGLFYQMISLCIRTKRLQKIRTERKYAAVISFSEMTNLSNVLVGDKDPEHQTKVITCVQNSVRKSAQRNWKYKLYARFILPFCLSKADKTVSCSMEIADELTEKYGLSDQKSAVIINGIDLKTIRKLSAEPLPHADAVWMKQGYTVVSTGRLAYQKGHWHLIRAINYLRNEGMDVKLMILGDGDLREKYEEMIDPIKSEDAVRLVGFVDNPFMYMAHAEAVVFPSLFEGYSNALVEALGCGAACISSDHATGAREVLAPEGDFEQKIYDQVEYAAYGVLVPVCDGVFRMLDEPLTPQEMLMADAIREMLTDPKLAAAYRAAALRRSSELGIRKISDQWIDLIEKGDIHS